MITDTEIKVKGLKVLTEALGTVEAEKFVALIMREPFDYTEWQRQLWPVETVEEISKNAMRYRRSYQGRRMGRSCRTSGSSGRGRPCR